MNRQILRNVAEPSKTWVCWDASTGVFSKGDESEGYEEQEAED